MTASDPPGPDDADFLSRWSARKRAAEETAPEPLAEAEPEVEAEADPELLASLPRIEDIGPGTDVRGFLQAGVPRALKNAALRRAWAANPLIANYEDPARDYFWDYNAPGGIKGFGGTISAQDVSQMAERIFAGAPVEEMSPAEDDAGSEWADVAAAPAPAAAAPTPPPAAEPAAQQAGVPAPPRHGGALPG
ncbi:MAG: DUF3306 domain-containing protein [Gemmobacter sp.]